MSYSNLPNTEIENYTNEINDSILNIKPHEYILIHEDGKEEVKEIFNGNVIQDIIQGISVNEEICELICYNFKYG